MIPKRVQRKPEKADNFTYLGEYIAAAREKGEKLDKLWIVNCDAGTEPDDLKTALYEIEAIRTLKPKIADKTYHLVVSFREGDRQKLTAKDLKDIERTFAEALGYGEHQRVAGTHVNTDHYHMHVAINKVHPKTLRMHSPLRDFKILHETARAIEQKYGLAVDRGMTDKTPELSAAARDFEARTWQQSFESHLKEHKADILTAIGDATTWREVHEALWDFNAGIKRHGAGLIFYHLGSEKAATMKASTLDRSCSLKRLQDRLGPYEPAERHEQDGADLRPAAPEPRRPYTARPLLRHAGQDRLWKMFTQQRRTPAMQGFLRRNFLNFRSWRDYLLADAHQDALAMAIIVSYRELLHALEGSSPAPRTHAPKSILPALQRWFRDLPWETPDTPTLHPDHIQGVGMKIDGDGRVVLPLRDRDGRTWALRAVDEQGRTCDMGEMDDAPRGLRHVLDKGRLLEEMPDGTVPTWRGPIVIATNCTTAAQMHKTTGMPVVIAAREKDVLAIADELRARFPEARVSIVSARYPQAAAKAAKKIGGAVTTSEQAIADATSWWTETATAAGHVVTVDRRAAERMGAFVDDALSATDAMAARPVSPELDRDRMRRAADHAVRAASVGHVVTVDRRTADAMGAFHDDALSPEDALAARPVGEAARQRVQEAGEKAIAAASRGEVAEVSPRVADALGAFHDDALSPEDALASVKRPAPAKPGPKAKQPEKGKAVDAKTSAGRKNDPGMGM